MKKTTFIRSLTAALAVIALAFALASCGNKGDAQETADATYEYDGRTVEFDITTMSSNLTWDEMQKAIDELNEKEYKGHSDWRMMESEDEVMAWWNAAGKNLYNSQSLSPVYIIAQLRRTMTTSAMCGTATILSGHTKARVSMMQ